MTNPATEQWQEWSCHIAVTTLDPADLPRASRVVRQVMTEVAKAVDRFDPGSDLSRVNAAAGRLIGVGELTRTLVELALTTAERTGNAVTPTVGAALVALGYDADIAVVRERSAPLLPPLCPAPPAAGAVRVDPVLGRLGVTRRTRLDLGALAKAYAVDAAVARIAEQARAGFVVSLGGDLAVHGEADPAWYIEVSETAQTPAGAGDLVEVVSGAVATSSILGRRWGTGSDTSAGRRHHLIDPRTGLSAEGPWRTATLWAPTTVEANTLSTWFLIDAEAAGRELARLGYPARLVGRDGTLTVLNGWPARADAQVA